MSYIQYTMTLFIGTSIYIYIYEIRSNMIMSRVRRVIMFFCSIPAVLQVLVTIRTRGASVANPHVTYQP